MLQSGLDFLIRYSAKLQFSDPPSYHEIVKSLFQSIFSEIRVVVTRTRNMGVGHAR